MTVITITTRTSGQPSMRMPRWWHPDRARKLHSLMPLFCPHLTLRICFFICALCRTLQRLKGKDNSLLEPWVPPSAPQKQTEKLVKVSKHFPKPFVRRTGSPAQTCTLRGRWQYRDRCSTLEIFHHLLGVSKLSWMRRTPAGTCLLRKGPH